MRASAPHSHSLAILYASGIGIIAGLRLPCLFSRKQKDKLLNRVCFLFCSAFRHVDDQYDLTRTLFESTKKCALISGIDIVVGNGGA